MEQMAKKFGSTTTAPVEKAPDATQTQTQGHCDALAGSSVQHMTGSVSKDEAIHVDHSNC